MRKKVIQAIDRLRGDAFAINDQHARRTMMDMIELMEGLAEELECLRNKLDAMIDQAGFESDGGLSDRATSQQS